MYQGKKEGHQCLIMKLKKNLISFYQITQTVLPYQAAITKFTSIKMSMEKVFLRTFSELAAILKDNADPDLSNLKLSTTYAI